MIYAEMQNTMTYNAVRAATAGSFYCTINNLHVHNSFTFGV